MIHHGTREKKSFLLAKMRGVVKIGYEEVKLSLSPSIHKFEDELI